MNTNVLKRFAKQARIRLLDDVTRRYLFWGFDIEGTANHKIEYTPGGFIFRGNVYNDETIPPKWNNLRSSINHHSPNDIIEEASYTWFNRLMAIKILEKNGYDVAVLGFADNGIDPILLQNAKQGITPEMDKESKRQLNEYLSEANDDEALSLLLIHYCKNHALLNRLFGRIDDYTELLLPNNLLSKNGIISIINSDEFITEDDYKEVELIGWLYQFYISDKKDDVFAGFKKKKKARAEDIPAATQIFTPKWIVKYLVENTVGRIWLDKHPESPIRESMKYLVEPENAEPGKPIIDNVTELKVLDPAVGSGHFLVVAFDLLMQAYKEEGYTKRYAVESIISHNLYGLDICKRAVGLASFAILLKGASYYPEILRKDITPRIFAMPESYEFSRQQVIDFLGENGREYVGELQVALTEMKQAQNIGSALVMDLTDNARDFIAKRINTFAKKKTRGELDLLQIGLLNTLTPFLHPILMLTAKYPAVVANPPYMGSKNMNADLSTYLKAHYPKSKSDLFAVFMEVLPNLTIQHGNFGIINLPSWLFLSTFENIRADYISKYFIMNMLHFGRGIFGIDWGSVAFTVNKARTFERNGNYFKLHERTFQHIRVEDIEKLFQYSYNNPSYKYDFRLYRDEDGINEIPENGIETGQRIFYPSIAQSNFSKIPGSPIAYWLPNSALNAIDKAIPLSTICNPRKGMCTRDNKHFVRLWSEVSIENIGFNCISREESNLSKRRWFPYQKGGEYRQWCGNNSYIVDWENDGYKLLNMDTLGWTGNSTNHNLNYIFKPAIVWSKIVSTIPNFRFVKSGFLFDDASGLCALKDTFDTNVVLGFLCSKVGRYYMDVINPTLNIQPRNMGSMPFIKPMRYIDIDLILDISKNDWNSRETSWDFEQSPLLKNLSSLSTSYTQWEEKATEDFFQLQKNEEELNRIFIDIYGLQDELTPDVALKDITILQEEMDRKELESRNGELLAAKSGLPIKKDVVIKQLISYAVGCFMGRYRLDKPGLNIAHLDPIEEELTAYSYHDHIFEIDDDGIIPTMGSESPFSDDIVFRVKEFIQMIWGVNTLTENLNFINECLGEDLEKYLTKKFWNDHKKTYKKKPIYWQFASPKGAFKVIAYMHRMNRFTVQKIRQNYLFKQNQWLEHEIQQLANNEALLSSKESKRLDNLRKNQVECREFDLILKDISDKQIEFDLDDGVTENYKLFEGVVSKI
jgi:hypothetical protein